MPLMHGSENAWIVLKEAVEYVKRFSIILMNNKALPSDLLFPRHATSHPELRHNYSLVTLLPCLSYSPFPCYPLWSKAHLASEKDKIKKLVSCVKLRQIELKLSRNVEF